MIVLDENLQRVYYDWPMAGEQMNALIDPSGEFSIALLSSIQ